MSNPYKRKEVIGDCTLLHCDCVSYMQTLPDKFYDIAIVDPPYAVGASDGSFGRGGAKAKNSFYRTELKHYANADNVPDQIYFNELFRVSKNQIIWGANYYPEYLTHSGWIVWDKKKSDGLLSEAELAFQSFNKIVNIFRFEWEGFRKAPGSFEPTLASTIHPNQKPVRLYEWLLEKYAIEGNTLLDTHSGSGSSAIAASNLGYKITCCELDETYYKAAFERITNAYRQDRMFP